ncbi:hypothetical protein T02_16332 [Trichinella nativa]|uniref:Uncharacterized protein n=1 Tax=Trichinella nativa TaxID=6335 RepID=A0A0V1LD59_9BILA|nr:hypothetical protein T02_16332 [Trichinella nativa]
MLSSTSEDLIMPLVSGTMSRNRFRELKRNFPMMENTELLPEDKLNEISAISSSNLSSDFLRIIPPAEFMKTVLLRAFNINISDILGFSKFMNTNTFFPNAAMYRGRKKRTYIQIS